MNSPQLENCPSCGALYLRDQIDCCLKCYHANEADFKKVEVFLRNPDHRNASIEDANRYTGISMNKIAGYLRDGRLTPADYPNFGYPCKRCGTQINRQMLCEECYRSFSTEVRGVLNDTQVDKQPANKAQYWKIRK